MNGKIQENPRPVYKLILFVMAYGYVLVMGVMAYMYWTRHVGRMAPPFVVSAAGMGVGLASLYFLIMLILRPSGEWTVGERGLHFVDRSAQVEWDIPWEAISRMKFTSVSLVIWWTETSPGQIQSGQLRRAVLFLEQKEASELMAAWQAHAAAAKQLQA